MANTLSKKIDIGPDNWNQYIKLSNDNYTQTIHNLFDSCLNPKQIMDLRILLTNDIEYIAKQRLKEVMNES